jgi:glycopeptide antibiotics resistance protein
MRIEMGEMVIHVLPVAVTILVAILAAQWRRQRSLSYLICCAGFGIYGLAVLHITLFPIRILDGEIYYSGARFVQGINLIPFNFDLSFIPHIVLYQIAQNVLLTIPLGFGVNFVAPIRLRSILWLALAVGIGIKTVQLMISLLIGYAYRVIDINDAILNTLGVLIGYGVSGRLPGAISG